MKIYIVMCLTLILAGCPVTYWGNLKNSSNDTVYHLTAWKPFEEPIKPGEQKRVNFRPGGCLELIINGQSRYFLSPEAPDDAFHPNLFSVDVKLLYSPEGVYYQSDKLGLIRFTEVDSCGT